MKRCKLLSIFLVMLLVTTMVTPNVQAAVKLNKSKATIYVGETLTLKLTGTKKAVKWSSSDKTVATVSSKGKVTAKSEGNVTITAKVQSKKYTCKVTVKETVTVKFTLPADTYENDLFFKSCFDELDGKLTKDGDNVIIKCVSDKVNSFKKDLLKAFDETIEQLKVNDAVSDIVINDKCTEIRVYNANDNMNADDALSLFFLYCLIPYYQYFSGTDYVDMDLYIKTYDASGKLIEEGSLKDTLSQ